MKGASAGMLTGVLVPAALLGMSLAPAPVRAQAVRPGTDRPAAPTPRAVIVYTAPTSGTWGPSAGAPPTFAFGKPAEVLLIVPSGYVVRQEGPLEETMAHAAYVSRQLGQPVAVTIPDPAGGPPRVEYVGSSAGDLGK
jgi:hypothetical protein